jgi:hypothetical protein
LLHIHFFLTSTLWMIIFITFRIFTFYSSPTSTFLTGKTLVFKSFFFNILDSFYTNYSIFLLKVAFRNPDSTNIMNPNIMTSWYSCWISWFYEVVIVTLLLFFAFFSYHFYSNLIFLTLYSLLRIVFLFLFIIWTFLRVLVITWIKFFENICINMKRSSFHSSTLNVT